MNKKTIITLLFALAAVTGWAQVASTTALLGSWSGKLNVGSTPLTLVLHLEQADGYVKVTLDSPDQGAKGIGTFKEFQHCTTGLVTEYAQIEETISPEVLSDITQWINSLK